MSVSVVISCHLCLINSFWKSLGSLFHSVIVVLVLTLLQLTCGICFDTFSRENIKSTACGHPFCSECWTGITVFTIFVTHCSVYLYHVHFYVTQLNINLYDWNPLKTVEAAISYMFCEYLSVGVFIYVVWFLNTLPTTLVVVDTPHAEYRRRIDVSWSLTQKS